MDRSDRLKKSPFTFRENSINSPQLKPAASDGNLKHSSKDELSTVQNATQDSQQYLESLSKITNNFKEQEINLFFEDMEDIDFELDLDEPLNKLIPFAKKDDENYKKLVIKYLVRFSMTRNESVVKPRLGKLSPTKKGLATKRKSFSLQKHVFKLKTLKDKEGKLFKYYKYNEDEIGFTSEWQKKIKPSVGI